MTNKKTLLIAMVAIIAFGISAASGAAAPYKGFANPNSVISVQELNNNKDKYVIVDFSGKAKELISGAIFIKRNDTFVKKNGVKMMRPTKAEFVKVLGRYGLTENTSIVIYSDNDNKFAARFYWDLKALGHEDVRLLDGGLPAWKAAGLKTSIRPAQPLPSATYTAGEFDNSTNADLALVKSGTGNAAYCILDTRTDKEYKKGRIPGAININFMSALNEDMTFKNASELKEIYKNVPTDSTIIAHCLGGIRAAHSWFVLSELLGFKNVKNYDGSWWEYEKSDAPIDK